MTPPLRSTVDNNSGVATDGGNPGELGRERHRILRELQRELERHPSVQRVTGRPDGRYRELRATLEPAVFGVNAGTATFRVTWWPAPNDPEYAFHYSDDTGFDCGWHREPNPHVDGKLHFDLLPRLKTRESDHRISGRARPWSFKTHTFQASPAGLQHRLGCLVARSNAPHPQPSHRRSRVL